MPVGLPSRGGPMGRTRGRLSASSLTTYLRCARQWLLRYQAGMTSPTRIPQILGTVLEDALCSLMMHHPPAEVEGREGLVAWAGPHLDRLVAQSLEVGEAAWEASLWKAEGETWATVEGTDLRARLAGGLSLFLDEVEACFNAGGGPYLEAFRRGEQPFLVPAPTWGAQPVFPLPDKVPDANVRRWEVDESPAWSASGQPIRWNEAWECARPWFKDPRVHQPQRLYHPEDWASGELDVVLRWDGRVRIVDIKSGRSTSPFASSLEHQLRFYAWLWHETHDGAIVHGLEGWYLNGADRVLYDAPSQADMEGLREEFRHHHESMQSMAEGVIAFPASPSLACEGTQAGCGWCAVAKDEQGVWSTPEGLAWVRELQHVSIHSPYQSLGSIQGRVSVKGRLTGAWGPMPNHFGEPVLGAVLVVGQQHITVEESEPGAFSNLHGFIEQDVALLHALPGVWRDQARLYVDPQSSFLPQVEATNEATAASFTRLGLLRTRANVQGHVLSISRRSGVRVDGKPWSMVSFLLWDGRHVAEAVAFGSSISQRLLELKPGDFVGMTGAEIGWRGGVLQLRIDNRKTRLETPRMP